MLTRREFGRSLFLPLAVRDRREAVPASNYTVNGNAPTPVMEFALPQDKFLYNRDTTATIYLGTDRGISAYSGFPLPPQSTKRWPAGDPLFAITDPGGTAILNVSDSSGEFVNPAAVASQLLTQGLDTAIANAINVVGVPAIERLTELLNTGALVFTDGVVPADTAVMDCRAFPSLIVNLGQVVAGYTGYVDRLVTVRWLASTNPLAPSLSSQTFFLSAAAGGGEITLPTRGPYVQITYGSIAVGTDANFSTQVWGSYRTIPRTRGYFSSGAIAPAPAIMMVPVKTSESQWAYQTTVPPATSAVAIPDVYVPGRVLCSVKMTAASAASELIISGPNSGRLAQVWIPSFATGYNDFTWEFYVDQWFTATFNYGGAANNSFAISFGFDAVT